MFRPQKTTQAEPHPLNGLRGVAGQRLLSHSGGRILTRCRRFAFKHSILRSSESRWTDIAGIPPTAREICHTALLRYLPLPYVRPGGFGYSSKPLHHGYRFHTFWLPVSRLARRLAMVFADYKPVGWASSTGFVTSQRHSAWWPFGTDRACYK